MRNLERLTFRIVRSRHKMIALQYVKALYGAPKLTILRSEDGNAFAVPPYGQSSTTRLNPPASYSSTIHDQHR